MAERLFIRTGDTVRLHHTVDAREILAAGGSSVHTGSVRLSRNGVTSIHGADAAIRLLDNAPANGVQLVPDVSGL